MRKVDQLFSEYGESHQTRFNKIIHYICVPAIVFSIVGLLASIPVGGLFQGILPDTMLGYANLGTILIIFSMLFYLRLSLPLAVGLLFFSAFVLWGNYQIAALFIVNGASNISISKIVGRLYIVAISLLCLVFKSYHHSSQSIGDQLSYLIVSG